jgi:arsenate reductase
MAEGWTRHLKGDALEPYSAGIAPKGVDPLAVRVMKEAGVDISGQRSKALDELSGIDFDFVVTVCDHAREMCPIFPGTATVLHRGFDDPPAWAHEVAGDEEVLGIYRRVRDEIRDFIDGMPESLPPALD